MKNPRENERNLCTEGFRREVPFGLPRRQPAHSMSRISASTLAALYREAAERFGDLPAFAAKDSSGVYQPISYRQLYEDGLSLATALIDLGLRQREHVGVLSDNRPEWILCDYGVLLAGCADVPRGTEVTGARDRPYPHPL